MLPTPPPSPRTNSAAPKVWPAQYEMLNGWRGLAALAVALAHVTDNILPLGHVAVMVFFVISGYCIAAAVESARRRGLSFWAFMGRRIRRIYPPYFFSLLFLVLTRVAEWRSSGINRLPHSPAQWIQTLTLTQWLHLAANPKSYAFNNSYFLITAHWTLGYEEQFYLVSALLLVLALRAKADIRVLVMGLLGVALAWNVCFPRISYGFFIEYWAHFALGAVVFYRLCRPFNRRFCQVVDGTLVGLAALCGVLAWPNYFLPPQRFVAQELFVVSLFALLLIALRRFDDWFKNAPLMRPFIWMGAITYSLYLTHQFNIPLSVSIVARLLHGQLSDFATALYQVLVLVLVAIPFWFFCERPFLNRKLAPTPQPAP